MSPALRPLQSLNFAFFFLAYYGYVGVFAPYASLYFADRGVSVAEIGVLMSMVQATRIFGPYLWGWCADYSQKRVSVLRWTAFMGLVSFCGIFVSDTFFHFFIVIVATNIFTSSQTPLSEAIMLSEMRGDLTQYGRLRLWGSIGFIAAVACSGVILDWRGIQTMPFIVILLMICTWMASMRLREPQSHSSHEVMPAILPLLRRPEVAAFFASAFLMVAAHAALYVFYSLYLAKLGYSKTFIGVMWSVGVVAEVAFFYYQTPLVQRWGVKKLMLGSFAVAAVRFLLIGLAARSVFLLFLAQLMHAASFGVHHSTSVMRMQHWFSGPLQARGQALFISVSYGLGGTLGGILLGLCWDWFDPSSVFWIAAALALMGLLMADLSYRWQIRAGR